MHFLRKFKYLFYKEYDPQWLVEAARVHRDEYPWLETELMKCTRAKDNGIMIYFVNPSNPNKLGSEWQFKENIVLETSVRGQVIVDVLKGNRIGAIELLDELIESVRTNA